MAKKNSRNAQPEVPASLAPRQALELVRRQVEEGERLLANRSISSAAERAWETVSRDVLIQAYGSASPNVRSVMDVGRYRNMFGGGSEQQWEVGRAEDMEERLVILRGLIGLLEHQTGPAWAAGGGDRIPVAEKGNPAEAYHFHQCTFEGGVSVAKQNVQAGGDISVGGDFVVADSVRDSFNKLDRSGVHSGVKDLVRQLGDAVKEMCEKLPDDKKRDAAQDFDILATEAAKDAPRKSYLKLAAEGLMAVAAAAGSVAVTGIVTALLKHWGIGS